MTPRTTACILLALASIAATPAPRHSIRVRVLGLRNSQGALVCRLFPSSTGFPAKPAEGMQQSVAILTDPATKAPTAGCTFSDLPDGTYAVTAFHDENGNGKLDTNFIGIPAEGVGVSNNHRGFGPPSWDDARVSLDRDLSLEISLRY